MRAPLLHVVLSAQLVVSCGARTELSDASPSLRTACGSAALASTGICSPGPTGPSLGSGGEPPSGLDAGDASTPADALPPAPDALFQGDAATADLGNATCFLINAAHTSAVGDPALAPPLARRWTKTFDQAVSYPLLVGGLVYITTNGGINSSKARLIALDDATGDTAFSVDLASSATSIASDRGRIFAVDESQAGSPPLIRAYDAVNGSLAWTTTLDPNQAFYDAPPVAFGGMVYVYGIGTGGTVLAYDESSGALVWRHDTNDGSEGSPAVSERGVFVSDGCQNTVALEPQTGATLWQNRGPCTGGGGSTPVLSGATLYVRDAVDGNQRLDTTTGNVLGTFVADLAPAFGADGGFYVAKGVLYAADLTLGTTRWTFSAPGGVGTVPVVGGSYVYVGSTIGTVFALDVTSGSVVWSENTGAPLASLESFTTEPRVALAVANGILAVPAGNQLIAYASAGILDGGTLDANSDAGCRWSLAPVAQSPATGNIPTSLAIGDVNGDGKLDLATTGSYSGGGVSILLGNGDGTFRARQETGSMVEGTDSVAIGDLNGDGKPDLAAASTYSGNSGNSSTVSVMLGQGDGTFAAPVAYATARYPGAVVIRDLNADGKPDLAVATGDTTGVSILLNRGDATFSSQVSYAPGTSAYTLAVGDLNGDGRVDLALADNSANQISVLLGNGDGTFQAPVAYAVSSTPAAVEMGDLNRDGKPDLVVADANVSVLLGRGDGTFQSELVYQAGLTPSSIGLADLDGDGNVDIAVTNEGAGSLSVLLGHGDGTFQWQLAYATGAAPVSVVVADLNADGKPDVAAANMDADSVSLFLGNCGP